MSLRDA